MTLTEVDTRRGANDLGASPMCIRKRVGSLEPVDVNKIVRAVARCCGGLEGVGSMRMATRTISGLCDSPTTEELDELSIRTVTALIVEGPNHCLLLTTVIAEEGSRRSSTSR